MIFSVLSIYFAASLAATFPHSLGPFEVVPVPLEPSSFSYNRQSLIENDGGSTAWMMPEHKARALGFEDPSFVFAQFSPISPITLEPEVRESLKIPEDATSFAWSYPTIQSLPDSMREHQEELSSFFEVGGFVYVDAQGFFKAATALIPNESGALRFGLPQHWKLAWTHALECNGRFQDITLDSLKEVALQFLWLLPQEVIAGGNGGPENPHGGFAYHLKNGGEVFFAVLGKEQSQESHETLVQSPTSSELPTEEVSSEASPTPPTPQAASSSGASASSSAEIGPLPHEQTLLRASHLRLQEMNPTTEQASSSSAAASVAELSETIRHGPKLLRAAKIRLTESQRNKSRN